MQGSLQASFAILILAKRSTMTEATISLSPAEIREVTGYRYHTKKIQALAMMGISYYVKPDGSPFVPRATVMPEVNSNEKPQDWVINM
jgi:hypothetical protein